MSPLAGFALGHGRSPCDGSVGKRRLLAGVWEKRNPAPRHRFFRIAPLSSCLRADEDGQVAELDVGVGDLADVLELQTHGAHLRLRGSWALARRRAEG